MIEDATKKEKTKDTGKISRLAGISICLTGAPWGEFGVKCC